MEEQLKGNETWWLLVMFYVFLIFINKVGQVKLRTFIQSIELKEGYSQVMWLHIKLYDKGTVPFLLVGTPHTLF